MSDKWASKHRVTLSYLWRLEYLLFEVPISRSDVVVPHHSHAEIVRSGMVLA